MRVVSDGFQIDFRGAIEAFKFDDTDPASPHFHKAPMKAVDIIAEFKNEYVFVEIKTQYFPEDAEEIERLTSVGQLPGQPAYFKWLKEYLKYKFRDSLLYRHAEGKLDKPVRYICLLNVEDGLILKIKSDLKKELPVGLAGPRWKTGLAISCHVHNLASWRRNHPGWPVRICR